MTAAELERLNGPWAPFSCLGRMGRTFFKCVRRNTLSGESEFAINASGYELLFERESDALTECRSLNAQADSDDGPDELANWCDTSAELL